MYNQPLRSAIQPSAPTDAPDTNAVFKSGNPELCTVVCNSLPVVCNSLPNRECNLLMNVCFLPWNIFLAADIGRFGYYWIGEFSTVVPDRSEKEQKVYIKTTTCQCRPYSKNAWNIENPNGNTCFSKMLNLKYMKTGERASQAQHSTCVSDIWELV